MLGLGLVAIVCGSGFLEFRDFFGLGVVRFFYGLVGFSVFLRLEVFSG